MVKNIGLWVCVVGLCFLGFNCAGTHQVQRKTSFYMFEYDLPIVSGKKRLPDTLRVKRFEISPLYDTEKIVFKENYH